jgi:hypothetical protein
MIVSIAVCVVTFWVLVALLRRDGKSFGLPIAYLFGLLLIHVPGAIAHAFQNVSGTESAALTEDLYTAIGIRFTAIGAVCFVVGVWLARRRDHEVTEEQHSNPLRFQVFCLMAGWFFTYGLDIVGNIPSVGAAIRQGGAVWMLGVMLGLRDALHRKNLRWTAIWLTALAVYPLLMLLLGGFLSYGSAASIIVLSILVVSIRSPLRVIAGVTVVAILSFNLFLSYFEHRNEIREAVWYDAPLSERVDEVTNMVRDLAWFDPADEKQLGALDARLNQNYFVGLAAARIQDGEVDYLYGRSLLEGAMSMVPRLMWPDKPVYGGSPRVVSEMTGLIMSETTSWGVGNVMEFQINFGTPGVVAGFLALGWLLGWLDRRAAIAEASGDHGRVFLFFLPAVAMIQPNGSLVEITGGPVAALIAAIGWRWLWNFRARRSAADTAEPVTT